MHTDRFLRLLTASALALGLGSFVPAGAQPSSRSESPTMSPLPAYLVGRDVPEPIRRLERNDRVVVYNRPDRDLGSVLVPIVVERVQGQNCNEVERVVGVDVGSTESEINALFRSDPRLVRLDVVDADGRTDR